jgi:hypothetical protein
MKKFTTLALATAMTAAMACTAFAGNSIQSTSSIGTANDDGSFTVDFVAAGIDATTVTGVTLTLTVDDSDGFGGGIMFNGTACGWDQSEDYYWGDADAAKALVATSTGNAGEYTVTFAVPDGEFGDMTAEDAYAQICVQQWWGNDVTITNVSVETSGSSDAGADDGAGAGADAGAAAGDVAPVAYLAAVVALAGVALVASKKVRA